ncbi:charged multivesicular body protein 7 [Xylocopa sonorina]|uniref:charged multivesicular body protein 7 n=1 Tax=Xylocopa sonorina TaxID=1818115 RepID=UPI00403AEE43
MSTKVKDVDNTLPLPPDEMPKCWNEEERIGSLFSPFRSKSVNPQDWVSKYKFWQNLIYEWLKHTKKSSFSIADLNSAFKRKGCTPLCLVTVVEELVRNNEIVPEAEFLKEPCESWTAWSVDIFMKRPLIWSLTKVKSYIVDNEINRETKYVHLQVVREFADILFSLLEEKKENILISFSDLVRSYRSTMDKNISDNTIMLLLIWLKREKKVVFRTSDNENELLIKIAIHPSDKISEIEEGLYKLMKQENELIKEIELMEKEKVNILNETKTCLAKGLRQVAKTHLKKNKKLETVIEKRAQTLDNIRSVITSIQDTHTNTAVLSAYKTGSEVLKKLNESGLSESYVKDVMDDLSEALEEQKEVEFILSESLTNDDLNTDLEAELTELMKLDADALPSVPNTKINTDIDELQKDITNLCIEEPIVPKVPPESKNIRDKKILKQPELECL